MHEMSLCESLRDIIEEQARAQSFTRVKRVVLEVGALSGVEVEALRFGFDVTMRGGPAEAAVLEIVDKPASAWCFPCGTAVSVSRRLDPCPRCGSHQLQVTGGDDLRILELEVN